MAYYTIRNDDKFIHREDKIMSKAGDTYWKKVLLMHATCDECGKKQKRLTKTSNELYIFHRLWEKINCFRRDDEIIKTLCEACYKEVKKC